MNRTADCQARVSLLKKSVPGYAFLGETFQFVALVAGLAALSGASLYQYAGLALILVLLRARGDKAIPYLWSCTTWFKWLCTSTFGSLFLIALVYDLYPQWKTGIVLAAGFIFAIHILVLNELMKSVISTIYVEEHSCKE